MPFQPFGYPFDIVSPMPTSGVKAAIRAQKSGWFEAKNGPRGWIVGPFLCLWNSVFDRTGPMVLARIVSEGHATRIHGRAGSDLNGLVALAFLTPVIAFVLYEAFQGQSLSAHLVLLIVFFAVGIPLTFWMANSDKREADPLIRFLRRAVEQMSANDIMPGHDAMETEGIRLLDENENELPATVSTLTTAIQALEIDGFLIIEREAEQYMQVLSRKNEYHLEKREGSADRHFQTSLPKGEVDDPASYDQAERDLIAIMTDYLYGKDVSHPLKWERMNV